jgi:hypothetical protein
VTVKVTVKDRGAKRAKQLLAQPRKVLRVGVLPFMAGQAHPSRGGVTIGDVARWMEYGTGMGHAPDTPARSWLNDPIDAELNDIYRRIATATLRVLFGKPLENEKHALEKIGLWLQRLLVDNIRFGNAFEGNAPSTIKKKGFDLPLIDTETFIESIDYEVV